MDLITDIIMGKYDEEIEQLSGAVKERKSILRGQQATALKFKLQKDSRVRFLDSVRPKYLAGVEATVVKVNPKKVLVKVDPGFGGSYFGKSINTPLSLIELV
jgi:nitrogen fixation/metabolism regulation signal transduction histidine kinase